VSQGSIKCFCTSLISTTGAGGFPSQSSDRIHPPIPIFLLYRSFSIPVSLLFGLDPSAFPTWFEDSVPLLISKPLNPYKRISANLSLDRKVEIFYVGDSTSFIQDPILLATFTDSIFLHENGLPLRVYFDRKYLEKSIKLLPEDGGWNETITACPYKGVARYFDVQIQLNNKGKTVEYENKIWTYPEPTNESLILKDLICFWAPANGFCLAVDGEVVK